MKSRQLLKVFALALSIAAYAAVHAQNAVGNWSGKIDFGAAKGKDANEQKQIDMVKAMSKSMTIKLVMKRDKTYTITFGGQGAKGRSETGKWSQSGKTITTVDPKGKKQTITISSNGKTMTSFPSPEEHAPAGIKIIFTRA